MEIKLLVFFSSTFQMASDQKSLLYLLNKHIKNIENQKIMVFNGCGEDYGIRGAIFGTGLDDQCQKVIEQVEAEIKKGNTVSLTVYGHSRGATAAALLTTQLSKVNPDLLQIHLALHDPVPGNLITTATLDLFGISLANKTMDLRECKPLKNVLALYPNEPLLFHTPLFNLYPAHTKVEEEVIAGCHSDAQWHNYLGNKIVFRRPSFISFALIFEFLNQCGIQFEKLPPLRVLLDDDAKDSFLDFNASDALLTPLLKTYVATNTRDQKSDRACHSANGSYIRTKNGQPAFFNLNHKRIAGNSNEDNSDVRVTIEKSNGPISKLKRALLHYPKTWQTVKWSLFSIGLASLIFFTGGLGSIPVLGGITANLGLLSIIVFAPVAGVALAGLWYGALKPRIDRAVNRFFYPQFHIRAIHPEEAQIIGSPQVITSHLGVTSAPPPTNPEPVASKEPPVESQPITPVASQELPIESLFIGETPTTPSIR